MNRKQLPIRTSNRDYFTLLLGLTLFDEIIFEQRTNHTSAVMTEKPNTK